jgi:hypothetical protein
VSIRSTVRQGATKPFNLDEQQAIVLQSKDIVELTVSEL